MSESRLDPSDAQITRHAMTQLAESMQIVRQCLVAAGFRDELLHDMILAWWTMTINQREMPDLGEILKGLGLGGEE